MFLIEEEKEYSVNFTFYNFAQIEFFRAKYYYGGRDNTVFEGYIYLSKADGNGQTIIFRNKDKFDNLLNMIVEKLPFIKIVFTVDDTFCNEDSSMFINLEKIFTIQSLGGPFSHWDNELIISFESGKHISYRIKTKKLKEEIFKRIRNYCVKIDTVKKKKSRLEILGIS